MVWEGQSFKIVPVALIEASERCEDQNGLCVAGWIGGCCQVVEVIVYHRRRCSLAVGLDDLFPIGSCGW